jgi:hypothetical protein
MKSRPLPAKATAALLRKIKPLSALFGEAQRLGRLQELLEAQLEPAAREHCRVAAWRDGCLLLMVSNGHWATRLHYQQRRLQRRLLDVEEFAGLNRILFKVRPATGEHLQQRRIVTLSPAAAESLHSAAEGIADPALRAALERLASHARPRD